ARRVRGRIRLKDAGQKVAPERESRGFEKADARERQQDGNANEPRRSPPQRRARPPTAGMSCVRNLPLGGAGSSPRGARAALRDGIRPTAEPYAKRTALRSLRCGLRFAGIGRVGLTASGFATPGRWLLAIALGAGLRLRPSDTDVLGSAFERFARILL